MINIISENDVKIRNDMVRIIFPYHGYLSDVLPRIIDKTLRTNGGQFVDFVVTDGTVSCYYDNLHCHQWQLTVPSVPTKLSKWRSFVFSALLFLVHHVKQFALFSIMVMQNSRIFTKQRAEFWFDIFSLFLWWWTQHDDAIALHIGVIFIRSLCLISGRQCY